MKFFVTAVCCFLTCFSTISQAKTSPSDIPAATFGSLPDISNVRLSPNGEKISFFARIAQKEASGTALRVFDFTTSKTESLLFSDNKTLKLNWTRWANDQQLLISTDYPSSRLGIPSIEKRLMIFDLETKKIRSAIPKKYFGRRIFTPQFQDRIVDMLPDDDNHILVQLSKHSSLESEVYKVSLNKKKMSKLHGARNDIVSWMTDRQHRVRIGTYRKDKKFKVIHLPLNSKKRQVLWEFEAFSQDEVKPLGFDHDENTLYVAANHQGRTAIFQVNLLDPNLEKTLIYSHPKFDVSGSLVYSHTNKKIVGISPGGKAGYEFWDTSYKALNQGLNNALTDSQNYFVSFSADENRYITLSGNDTQAGVFYLGDRKSKTLTKVARRYKDLPQELMSPKMRVSYKARDDLKIEGYVTLPLGHQDGQKYPTVIFPHGGPTSADDSSFDNWTQLFASRGYAVLQMNFRGSSGYGHRFLRAGFKNWGLAMQDDVADGTQWMIDQGYSDSEKICIVGGSYGGYAAMMGAIKTPELYKCAISFAGISDMARDVKMAQNYAGGAITKEVIGSNYRDLKQRSPIDNADKIDIPILLIHGEQDRVVNVSQSRKMHKAMKKLDKNVDYIELKNGSHQLRNEKNRATTFKAMDDFLAKHLL